MADKIVQLKDETGNNIFPLAAYNVKVENFTATNDIASGSDGSIRQQHLQNITIGDKKYLNGTVVIKYTAAIPAKTWSFLTRFTNFTFVERPTIPGFWGYRNFTTNCLPMTSGSITNVYYGSCIADGANADSGMWLTFSMLEIN